MANGNTGQKWSDLIFSDKAIFLTAILSFFFGWTLTFIGFFTTPRGEVSDSVLWILGQALIYCGGALGITNYVGSKISFEIDKFKTSFNKKENNETDKKNE